jgi:hypothetical protein
MLNRVASGGFAKWEVNATQGVLGKAFLPFGLSRALKTELR